MANPFEAIVQLMLAGRGADNGGWATTVTPTPEIGPWKTTTTTVDEELLANSRDLRAAMQNAQSLPIAPQGFQDAAARRAEQMGSGLRGPNPQMMQEIQALRPGYEPGQRESRNVEDRRGQPQPPEGIVQLFTRLLADEGKKNETRGGKGEMLDPDSMPFAGALKMLTALAGTAPEIARSRREAVIDPPYAADRIREASKARRASGERFEDQDPDALGRDAASMGASMTPGLVRAGTAPGAASTTLGTAGGRNPPKITALIESYRKSGNKEFEELADGIYRNLVSLRGETVAPASKTAMDIAEGTAKGQLVRGGLSTEGQSVARLSRQMDAERISEIAERAAAWQLYQRRLGNNDFELGSAGGRGKARYSTNVDPETGEKFRFKGQPEPKPKSMGGQQLREHNRQVQEMAAADPNRPAKDIIREWRAKNGEGGPTDMALRNAISKVQAPARRLAGAQKALDSHSIRQMIEEQLAGGASEGAVVKAVNARLGLDNVINKSDINRVMRETVRERQLQARVGAERVNAAEAVLNDPSLQQMIKQEASLGGNAASIAAKIRAAVGMDKNDPTISVTAVRRMMEPKGRD